MLTTCPLHAKRFSSEIYPVPPTPLGGQSYHYLHFTEEATGGHRGQVTKISLSHTHTHTYHAYIFLPELQTTLFMTKCINLVKNKSSKNYETTKRKP